jgi:putative transcriptional regulator
MQQLQSLKNHLLIAMPQLGDSWFEGTVTYLCEHNEEGAMGLVLNKPLKVSLDDICQQLDIDRLPGIDPAILAGGPVSREHGFILHRQQGQWDSTLNVEEEAHLTSSKDILKAIAAGDGPRNYRMALGYAGWDAQQLDEELKQNSWLTVEASSELLFATQPEDLYRSALNQLGISPEFLSSDAGHA